jgi:hypothetical protein
VCGELQSRFYLRVPLALCSAEIAPWVPTPKSPLVITLAMHRGSVTVVVAAALSAKVESMDAGSVGDRISVGHIADSELR